MDSILISIKKLLGIAEEYEQFDIDLIIHINSAFSTLTQLGIGPEEGFFIEDETTVWSDYVQDNNILGHVKTYVFLKTKILFDPPASATILEAYNRSILELEYRLIVTQDSKTY